MTHTNNDTFKVQAGKRYNRKDGTVSGGIGATGYDKLYDMARGQSYNENGESIYGIRGTDLISEYIEPHIPRHIAEGWGEMPLLSKIIKEPAEDEYGPWIGWNGGVHPVDEDVTVEIASYDGHSDPMLGADVFWEATDEVLAYRIKKEPVARHHEVWLYDGGVYLHPVIHSQRATITTQGDNISIKWA